MNESMNELMTKVSVEQPLALHVSSNKRKLFEKLLVILLELILRFHCLSRGKETCASVVFICCVQLYLLDNIKNGNK